MVNLAEARKIASDLLVYAVNANVVGLPRSSKTAERASRMIEILIANIEALSEENSKLRVLIDRLRPEEGAVRG